MKLSKTKDKENLKSRKRKESCNLQGNPDKAISKFLSRNLTGQEREGKYIQIPKKLKKNPN